MIGFACALVLAGPCASPVPALTLVEYRASGLNARAALAEINAFRRRHGLKPVVLDQRLSRAAAAQAQTQARRGKIGHQGADGSKPWDRAKHAGYAAHLTAENVASGQRSFSEAMRGWERSGPTSAISSCPMRKPRGSP
jgi:uncharacterized protein YkwD